MSDGVVVIPECPGSLRIGVVVVFILSRLSCVFCPAVKGCTTLEDMSVCHFTSVNRAHTIRAVEMNRVCTIGMVNETNDRFTPLLHFESRSRDGAIVSNMPCFLARVDLDIDRLDVNLVIVNVVV